MPRPVKCRMICNLPLVNEFGPLNQPYDNDSTIMLHLDEYETIRLIDLEKYSQEECAKQMNIARTTVQGIYEIAREKLATAIVKGKRITIEGGSYVLCNDRFHGCRNGECNRYGKNQQKRGIL